MSTPIILVIFFTKSQMTSFFLIFMNKTDSKWSKGLPLAAIQMQIRHNAMTRIITIRLWFYLWKLCVNIYVFLCTILPRGKNEKFSWHWKNVLLKNTFSVSWLRSTVLKLLTMIEAWELVPKCLLMVNRCQTARNGKWQKN